MYSPIDIFRSRIQARLEPAAHAPEDGEVDALNTIKTEAQNRLNETKQELTRINTELTDLLAAEAQWYDGKEGRKTDSVVRPVIVSNEILNQTLNATRETLTRLTELVQKETDANKRQRLGTDINTVKAEIAAVRAVISANNAKISRYVNDGITPEGENVLGFSRKEIELTLQRKVTQEHQVAEAEKTLKLVNQWLNSIDEDAPVRTDDTELSNVIAALVALDNRYTTDEVRRGQIIRTLTGLSHLNVINDLRDALNRAHEREVFLDS